MQSQIQLCTEHIFLTGVRRPGVLAHDASNSLNVGLCVCHRECENNALFMKGKDLNFNTAEEEQCVDTIFSQAMECLKEEDRSLNFIETLLPLLKRGIGVHHSGLLPILKEIIELLFQEQLIKVSLSCLHFDHTETCGALLPTWKHGIGMHQIVLLQCSMLFLSNCKPMSSSSMWIYLCTCLALASDWGAPTTSASVFLPGSKRTNLLWRSAWLDSPCMFGTRL